MFKHRNRLKESLIRSPRTYFAGQERQNILRWVGKLETCQHDACKVFHGLKCVVDTQNQLPYKAVVECIMVREEGGSDEGDAHVQNRLISAGLFFLGVPDSKWKIGRPVWKIWVSHLSRVYVLIEDSCTYFDGKRLCGMFVVG